MMTTLNADLKTAITKAANGGFPETDGGYYSLAKGWYDTDSYFFQFGATSTTYNLDVTVTLISMKTVMAKTTSTEATSVTNSDGSVSVSNRCVIEPKKGVNSCSYLVHAEERINWQWTLNSWTYA